MNVQTITMDPTQAKSKLKSYRTALHETADENYQAAARGYAALAQGHMLLDLSQVFSTCPMDDKGRPRLAVARADRKEVALRITGNPRGFTFDCSKKYADWNGGSGNSTTVVITTTAPAWPDRQRSGPFYAPVPMVPADVRPKGMNASKHHILWEVDAWAERPRHAPPSRDPYLLKHVGGALYAVVASWDLTDLEVAVMRAQQQ